ncbi:hypothetical protein OCAR_6730 [Afipia carboxidovorans OM5]|nr:hypothetical protein OCAR_6730 [Afipia carboxidovorans OM5]
MPTATEKVIFRKARSFTERDQAIPGPTVARRAMLSAVVS